MADPGERGGEVHPALNDHAPTFYVDNQPGKYWDVGDHFIYERHVHDILGEAGASEEDDRDVRRCFNCGSPLHVVSSCPEPYNHRLVSLSRQLFNFFNDGNSGESRRIHEVEEWKRQRVEWLETFEPGHIRGPLLREALGLVGDDVGEYVEWLPNIAIWGYPKGWVGRHDPRLRVWQTIMEPLAEGGTRTDGEPISFKIHGEMDIPEELVLPVSLGSQSKASLESYHDDEETEESACSDISSSLRRWARYPETYFSSSILPVYNGLSLPPITSSSPKQSSTFSTEREALWANIVNGRAPAVSLHFHPLRDELPPPPPSSPPPLPPEPCEAAIPLVPLAGNIGDNNDGEVDMELSDSE